MVAGVRDHRPTFKDIKDVLKTEAFEVTGLSKSRTSLSVSTTGTGPTSCEHHWVYDRDSEVINGKRTPRIPVPARCLRGER